MRAGLTALALALTCCAPRGPTALSAAQLQSRATRAIGAPFDELFEATWLTLELAGWTVAAYDARAGTLETNALVAPNGLGRAWSAVVTQDGTVVKVTLLPRVFQGQKELTEQMHWTLEGPGGEVERWDALFSRIAGLVETWRVHPELVLSNSRGEVDAGGLRLLVPNWRHFEFSVDRRSLVMHGAGSGLVPTLLYRIERRRPRPDQGAVVREAMERAFHSTGQVAEPAQWDVQTDGWGETAQGEVLVGAGLTARPVHWRRWEARSPAWLVRVVAVCSPEDSDCERDVRAVVESAVNTGAAVPGFKTR